MQFGVVFPQTEFGDDPAAIRDYAQTAEQLAYDYLLAYDHVLGANPDRPGGWARRPYTHEDMFHEPLVLFSYLAGITETLSFATGILILPQRQTVLVAKQAAEVDVLSGGRLRIGVGVGWNEVEYEALNEPFHNRGRRQAEQVRLLQELWTKPLVTFQGDYHKVSDAGLNPLPVQRPIPVWFGGGADIVLRRMARLGAGWMPNSMPLERLQRLLETLRGYLKEEGRDPNEFGIDVRLNIKDHPEDEWADQVEMIHDLGATHLCVNTMGAGFSSPEEHIEAIERFKAVVDSLERLGAT